MTADSYSVINFYLYLFMLLCIALFTVAILYFSAGALLGSIGPE